MALMEMIAGLGGWAWIVAGLVLLAIEIVAPGGIFIWFGIAGVLTGIASLQIDFGWSVQALLFLALSFGSIFVWRAYRKARPDDNDQPFLNQRAHRYLGQAHVLEQDIVNGEGVLNLDATIWRIRANRDTVEAGETVRIVGAEGAILLVEVS